MLKLVKINGKSNYKNEGDFMESKFINSKFNYYVEDKKLDLRAVNGNKFVYINMGDDIKPEEINDIINNKP